MTSLSTSREELLRRLIRERVEPIAVVGVGLRFPGDNTTRAGFAQFLRDGRSGTGSVPRSRWDVDAYYAGARTTPGRVRTTGGGFLGDLTQFDARFFNISPKEARFIDPQQRLALETAWEALEDAGIDPTQAALGDGGVYVGVSCVDYTIEVDDLDLADLDPYVGTGTAHSAVPGRISYFLGWRGPSLAVDTACSSSLYALHLAVNALRAGECPIALCGGVNAIHHPRNHIVFSQANMLAPDGRCKTFDAGADGYSRSEGAAMVVLKRLSDARRDGDRVLGLVRGTAVGQDGESGGLTVPNGAAQEKLMRAALVAANLEPPDIDVIEAHGTGTALGDPIEMSAIGAVFGESHSDRRPLLVSSLKTNVGHMEAAAGIGGVIKALLQVEERQAYPHLNLDDPTPHVDWHRLPVRIPHRATGLTAEPGSGPARCLVNSFGFAGSIASAVVEQPPALHRANGAAVDTPVDEPTVLTISARTRDALPLQVREWQRRHGDLQDAAQSVASLARASAGRRAHLAHRVAGVVSSSEDVERFLAGALERGDRPAPASAGRVALLYTGQGSQYVGMGSAAYQRFRIFREVVDECDELFGPWLGHAVRDSVTGQLADPDRLRRTQLTQAALFTVELATTRLWQSFGVTPSVLTGHSIGEVVAAAVAGVLDLPDAVHLTAERGRLMQSVTVPGGMAAVLAPVDAVEPVLAGRPLLGVAAVNTPEQCVLSGELVQLESALAELTAAGHRVHRLEVSHAFHSPLMQDAAATLRSALDGITFHEPAIRLVSTVLGRLAEPAEVTSAEYWSRHILAPVRFSDGLAALAARGRHTYLEVGPSATLVGFGRRTVDDPGSQWLASHDRARPDRLLTTLAALYESGLDVDWSAVHGDRPTPHLDLPLYQFDRSSYWLPTGGRRHRRGPVAGRTAAAGLLGTRVDQRGDAPDHDGATAQLEYRLPLEAGSVPWLADHVVLGQQVFPATGYVEVMLEALDDVDGTTSGGLRDLRIHEALVVDPDGDTELVTRYRRDGDAITLTVHSASRTEPGRPERHHATAGAGGGCGVDGGPQGASPGVSALVADLAPAARAGAPVPRAEPAVDVDDLYATFDERGLSYGPGFRRIRTLRPADQDTVVCTLDGRPAVTGEFSPPELLDSVIQSLGAVVPATATYLPVGFGEVALLSRPRSGQLVSVATLRATEGQTELRADLLLLDGDRPVVAVRDARLRRVARGGATTVEHQRTWRRVPAREPEAGAPHRVRLVGSGRLAGLVGQALTARGHDVQPLVTGGNGSPAAPPPGRHHLVFVWTPLGDDMTVDRLQRECDQNFGALLAAVAELERDPGRWTRVWLVTGHAQRLGADPAGPPSDLIAATLWGFGPSMAVEYPGLAVTLVDLDGDDADAFVDELERDVRREQQVAFRGGHRFGRRLRPVRRDAGEPRGLAIGELGRIDRLTVAPVPVEAPVGSQVQVEVLAAGLNFKDVLNVLGMLKAHAETSGMPYQPLPLGFEGAGVVVATGPQAGLTVGSPVFFSHIGSMRSVVTVPVEQVAPVPPGVSLDEAAGLATAYITAYHALVTTAGLAPSDTVLVVAAAGGVGQAAVRIAQSVGATVVATASPAKHATLHEQGVRHVFTSRSTEFADQVLEATDGGVDVVLNSLSGDLADAAMRCLAEGGRFVELGKIGVWGDERAQQERPDASYAVFDLSELDQAELDEINRTALGWVTASLDDGTIQPLPVTAYALDEAAEAFGTLSRGANVGKLVIHLSERVPDRLMARPVTELPAATLRPTDGVRPVELDPAATYLVTGAGGALGRLVAARLGALGARRLLAVGRSALDPEVVAAVRERSGVALDVRGTALDVGEPGAVAALAADLDRRGERLGGVVHCAGVLADAPVATMTLADLQRVLHPKVSGGWQLHELTGDDPDVPFVMFSSVASVVGSAGQANYAAANAFLDVLADWRVRSGRSATSLNWGPWAEVGMAASLGDRHLRTIEAQGMRLLAPTTGLRAFARALTERPPERTVCEFDWSRLASARTAVPALFDDVVPVVATGDDPALDLSDLRAAPEVERRERVADHVRARVARLLQFDRSQDVPLDEPFHDLGLDSLSGVELKNQLSATFGVSLPASAALEYPTVNQISGHVVTLLDGAVPAAP